MVMKILPLIKELLTVGFIAVAVAKRAFQQESREYKKYNIFLLQLYKLFIAN